MRSGNYDEYNLDLIIYNCVITSGKLFDYTLIRRNILIYHVKNTSITSHSIKMQNIYQYAKYNGFIGPYDNDCEEPTALRRYDNKAGLG